MRFVILSLTDKKINKQEKEGIRSRTQRKMNREEQKELLNACSEREWEKAKAMIAKKPELVCTAGDWLGRTPVFWAVYWDESKMLQYIADAVLSLKVRKQSLEEHQQVLRDAFKEEELLASEASCFDNIDSLVFLMDHVPSGTAVLEKKFYRRYGRTCAHEAARYNCVDLLEFIVRNAPSGGVAILAIKNCAGETPSDAANARDEQQVVKCITNLYNRMLPSVSSGSGNHHQAYKGSSNHP